ncbi:MAG: type II toxin-antitoxin system VapC family toxin [Janthinobacterium lividum]
MLLDTNRLIQHIRHESALPADLLLSIVVVAELEAFSLKSAWGSRRQIFLQTMRSRFPIIEITELLLPAYAQLDAYSQGKLKDIPLPPGMSARNMGKNDLWLAATALYFDVELHTADNDFDHLGPAGVRVIKPA